MNKQQFDEPSAYFKCDHCSQEFSVFSFRIAVYLYGVIFLADKRNGYVGIVCPNCLKTTLKKMGRARIEGFKRELGERIIFFNGYRTDLDDDKSLYERGHKLDIRDRDIDVQTMEIFDQKGISGTYTQFDVVGNLKYDSFTVHAPVSSEGGAKDLYYHLMLTHDFDFDSSFKDRICYSDGYKRDSLWPKLWDNFPEVYSKYTLCSYPFQVPTEDRYFHVYWFKESDLDFLLTLENDSDYKIFPRYFFDNKIRNSCLKLRDSKPLPSQFDSYDLEVRRYSNLAFLLTLDDVDVFYLCDFEIGVSLMRLKDPFKDNDVPIFLKDIVLSSDEEMKSYANHLLKIGAIRRHISRNSIQEMLPKMSIEFYLEFDALKSRRDCSTGAIWEVKQKYLKDIYDSLTSPTKRKKIAKQTGPLERKEVKKAEEKFKDVEIVSQDFQINKIKIEIPHYVRPEKERIDILILGETGTGKDLIAQACHNASGREGQFVVVNATAIPSIGFESEVFGHAKGAFTDAKTERKGKFKEANRGTIFLDEIGEMDIELQSRLLRVIENREIQPLGKDRTEKVDVMLIMATNKDLLQCVENGSFRKDLYYRITAGEVVSIPPLRGRKNDIPLLIKHFIQKTDWELKKDSRLPELKVSQGCLKLLKELPWEGNVRELEGLVKGIVNNRIKEKNRDEISEDDIPTHYFQQRQRPRSKKDEIQKGRRGKTELTPENIKKALRDSDGVIAEAARELGYTREYLSRTMKEKGIDRKQFIKKQCSITLPPHPFLQTKRNQISIC